MTGVLLILCSIGFFIAVFVRFNESVTQETEVKLGENSILKLNRKLTKPNAIQDACMREILDIYNKIVPNFEQHLYKCARQGVHVDSMMILIKSKGIGLSDDYMKNIERAYEYVCSKVYFEKK